MVQTKEHIFTDIARICKEKERISDEYSENKWKIAEYRAGEYSGNMLICPETVFPPKLTLQINVKGVYRIYLCFPRLRSENYFYIKTSDEMCYTGVRAKKNIKYEWQSEENFEEVYWKTADLTGRDIIISKPDSMFDCIAGLAWIRLEEADSSEIFEQNNVKCVQMHFDEDMLAEDSLETEEDYFLKLYQLRNTNTDFLSFEISFDYDKIPDPKTPRLHRREERWDRGMFSFTGKTKERFYSNAVKFAHENGFEIYATNRSEVGNFSMPYTMYGWNFNFVKNHPELYIKNRDGSTIKACSYAYKEVWDYLIAIYLDVLKYGFDGLSLIFHRGIHIGFEQPVIDRFKEKYPDINPCLLPYSDKRLHDILCSFVNEFMEQLRASVDKNFDRHIKINVIMDYSLETSKNFGLDAAYWAKCGYIDSVSQADMEMYEDLEGCMSNENTEFIDLEKYSHIIKERAIIKRNFATNVVKVIKHIPEYVNLKEKYGVEVYNILPWVHTFEPYEYDDVVEKMRKAGAKKFFSWNTNHLVWDLPEWYVVSRIGNERNTDIIHRKIYRVLSLDGDDVSHFNVNWRG